MKDELLQIEEYYEIIRAAKIAFKEMYPNIKDGEKEFYAFLQIFSAGVYWAEKKFKNKNHNQQTINEKEQRMQKVMQIL